jgi:hypothetical protein
MTQDFRIGGDGGTGNPAANPNAYGIYSISAGTLNTGAQRLNMGTGGIGVFQPERRHGNSRRLCRGRSLPKCSGSAQYHERRFHGNQHGHEVDRGDNGTGTINVSGTVKFSPRAA